MPTTKQTYAVTAYTMKYVDGSSNKFYQVFITESGVCILRWGRRGTAGQHSATSYGSYQDAHDVGMRQVYAKRSKGYVSEVSDFKFMASETAIKYALQGNPGALSNEFQTAFASGEFAGAKDTVLKHYADFAEQVKVLMDDAETADAGDVLERLNGLEEIWDEISGKHAEVQIALNVAKQTATRKLLGI